MLQQAEKTECTLAVHAGRARSSLQTRFSSALFSQLGGKAPASGDGSSPSRWVMRVRGAERAH